MTEFDPVVVGTVSSGTNVAFACAGGIEGAIGIDWPQLMRFTGSFTDPVPEERESVLRKAGIATYHGVARFVDETTIEL